MSKKQQENQEETGKPEEEVGPSKPKVAFFITPVAQPNSDIRRATDGVIDAVLKPVLERHGFDLIAPHRVSIPGSITKQVIRDILRADLVIANLTGLNANVMYELAVRHAKRLPVITIAQKGTDLPFDIAAERTLFYTNDMHGVIELTNELDQFIPQAMSLTNPDNPIYSGLESLLIQQESINEADPVQNYILRQLEELNSSIKALKVPSGLRPSKGFYRPSGVAIEYKFVLNLPANSTSDMDEKYNKFKQLLQSLPNPVVILDDSVMLINDTMSISFSLNVPASLSLLRPTLREAGFTTFTLDVDSIPF